MNRKRDILAAVILVCSLGAHAQDDRYQCDDTCEPGTSESVAYNVVCPVGFSTVEPVEMAPRLATLEGKTIAVLPQAFRRTTTWHVAVNACMAGCKPEYMPILIAITKAVGTIHVAQRSCGAATGNQQWAG